LGVAPSRVNYNWFNKPWSAKSYDFAVLRQALAARTRFVAGCMQGRVEQQLQECFQTTESPPPLALSPPILA